MHAEVCMIVSCLITFESKHDAVMRRYLRATKWAGSQVAIKRLEGTLRFRREYGFYDGLVAPEHVEPEVRRSLEPATGL